MTPNEEEALHMEIAAKMYRSVERVTSVTQLCKIVENDVCTRLDKNLNDPEALSILDDVVARFKELAKEDSHITQVVLPLIELQTYLHSL